MPKHTNIYVLSPENVTKTHSQTSNNPDSLVCFVPSVKNTFDSIFIIL